MRSIRSCPLHRILRGRHYAGSYARLVGKTRIATRSPASSPKLLMALTDKQKRFVEDYLVDLNATQAAVRAGYSAKTAEQQAYQILQKTSVSEAIAAAQAARSERTELTQD